VHVLRSELVAATASPLQPVKWSSQESFQAFICRNIA